MKGNSPRSPDDGPSTAKCAINTVRAKLGSQPREILIEEGKSSFSSVDFLPSSNGPPLVRDTLAISREISTVANRIETNPASSFLPIRSNDTERVLSGDPSHRPRERRPQWRAMAINYNIMVSLLTFLCSWLTRPGLTPKSLRIALLSLENTTEQGRQCQKERERESERERERETAEAAATYSVLLLPGAQHQALIFAPEDEANPTMRAAAHATVPPHPLSSNVSFFPRMGIPVTLHG